MEEIWKNIKGLTGYQISNLGRVKSLAKNIVKGNIIQHRNERILTPHLNIDGYLCININYNHKNRKYFIHRLIAENFIPNPNNYPCINHKDENKLNNSISNLEWCTFKYNVNYGTAMQRRIEKQSKSVIQYDLQGNKIAEYKSIKDAAIATGINKTRIAYCCKQEVGGFIWKYNIKTNS